MITYRSKRIYFFMAEEDDKQFLKYIFSLDDMFMVHYEISKGSQPIYFFSYEEIADEPVISSIHGQPSWLINNKKDGTYPMITEITDFGPYINQYVIIDQENDAMALDRSIMSNNNLQKGELVYS
jgi:hypothetical protein